MAFNAEHCSDMRSMKMMTVLPEDSTNSKPKGGLMHVSHHQKFYSSRKIGCKISLMPCQKCDKSALNIFLRPEIQLTSYLAENSYCFELHQPHIITSRSTHLWSRSGPTWGSTNSPETPSRSRTRTPPRSGKCSTVLSLISICVSVLQFAATVEH